MAVNGQIQPRLAIGGLKIVYIMIIDKHQKLCEPSGGRDVDWSSLPIAVLVIIFDNVLVAPTPHHKYLPEKLRHWTSLFRTCKQWREAIRETGVGVCLPKRVDARMRTWLKKVRGGG